MSTPNDGGPAFPRTESRDSSGPCYVNDSCARIVSTGGMSLRDWFAAKCPLTLEQSAIVYGMSFDDIIRHTEHTAAFFAMDAGIRLDWADAMLAARAQAGKEAGL